MRESGTLLVLGLLFLAPLHASAQTFVESETVLEEDVSWTVTGNPYVILGDVTVAEGARLSVEAGVTLFFEQGAGLIVRGGISALGTEANPVIITSLYDPELVLELEAFPEWGGITLLGDASDFSHTLLRYATEGILSTNTAPLSLDSVVFESGSGLLLVGAEAEISNVSFTNTSYPLYLIGASVLASAVSIDGALGNAILAFNGSSFVASGISIDGAEDEAVLAYGDGTIVDLSGVEIKNSGGYGAVTAYTNADIVLEDISISGGGSTVNGIAAYGGAALAVASSSISGFSEAGVQTFGSDTSVSIAQSRIEGNAFGVLAFSDAQVAISSSVIAGNTLFGVQTFGTTTPVIATGNYWGDASGPQRATSNPEGTGNAVSSFTMFDPWLTNDPFVACATNCYSNVLFLPGLQSSKLYLAGERVWPPPLIHDNSQLFLNASGTPATDGVYTQDVLDEVLGANVYKSFVEMMDEMTTAGTIEEWAAYPYDWRLDINNVVANPTALEATVISLVDEVGRLAGSSRTDKITIVAHSNGGLIGKLLISELVEQGKENLVDKFVMVAVPQLGTPKAIASLLHGQGLPFEWLPVLLSKSDSRTIAENMPSAYTLLPSEEYFARVASPVVEFAPSNLTVVYREQYGSSIDSREELEQFLLGVEGRAEPSVSDTFTPNVLNEYLLDKAHTAQNILDTWTPPSGISVTQIVGWGAPTIAGIRYVERKGGGGVICAITSCTYLDNEPILTVDGDKTVVSASAGMFGQEFYLNLSAYNKTVFVSKDHKNILEVEPILIFLQNFLISNTYESEYISQVKPTPSPSDKSLRMRVLSPISIDLYDEIGNHTGIATNTPDGVPRIEEHIPNSYYFEFGEGKYAGADSPNVKVYLNGQAEGTFTLDVENVEGDTVVSSTSFENVPVTSSSLASLDISEGQTLSLQLDTEGDGALEENVAPGEYVPLAPAAPAVESPRSSSGGRRTRQVKVPPSLEIVMENEEVEQEILQKVVPITVAQPQRVSRMGRSDLPISAQSVVKTVVEQNLQAKAGQRSLAATVEAVPKGFFKNVLSRLSKWLKVWSW